jgi:hypothetical protein
MATSKALRAAPPKNLNNYMAYVNKTLNAPESVNDNKFINFLFESTAPEIATSVKETIPLGFTLEFAHNQGYKYKQVVVARAGWIALIENSDASIETDLFTGSSTIDNSTIEATFARNHILLAPWFDNQSSIATTVDQLQAGGAYASLTSEDILKIKRGHDNKNYPYDMIDRSVRYLNYNDSNKGKCLLIRWTNSQLNYGKRYKFEVAIFETGKFEFRYWPSLSYTPGDSTPTSSTATVGVFWNGTDAGTANRFRDFAPLLDYKKDTSRPISQFGGASYSAGYSEISLPYSSQISENYWPTKGAVIHFAPPVNLGKFLPKKLSQNISLSKKLVGDAGAYDDRKTFNFSGNINTNVYMPSTLRSRLLGDTGDADISSLQLLIGTGSITVPGKQNKNIVDSLLKQLSVLDSAKSIDLSFNEHQKNYKSILTSSNFYYNSSSLGFFGSEFDSSLASKTQFHFSLPVNKTSIMNPTTSSLYYYDAYKKGWTLMDPDGYRGPESLTIRTIGESDENNYYRITETARGFDAVGRKVVSGSRGTSLDPASFVASYQTDNIVGSVVNQVLSESSGRLLMQAALNKSYNNSITDNQKFFPDKNQQVDFQITEPFLIEKIVVKLPFYAENEWFKDITTCNRAYGETSPVFKIASGAIDFGGPGITFSMFCPRKSGNATYMDLIASGTFTHQLDNKAEVYMQKDASQQYYSIRPAGFLSFSNPTAVVSGTWNGSYHTFDGNVTLEMEASVAGGVTFARNDRSQINTNNDYVQANVDKILELFTSEELKTLGESSYNSFDINPQGSVVNYRQRSPRVYIQQVSPLARGTSKLEFNGNSILGGNIAYARVEGTVKNPLFVNKNAEEVVSAFKDIATDSTFNFDAVSVYSTVDSRQAPYLIMPGDKLTFCVSKTRPVIYRALQTAARAFGYYDYQTYILTGSHNTVALNTGSLDVTIYGSYVKEGMEYHR